MLKPYFHLFFCITYFTASSTDGDEQLDKEYLFDPSLRKCIPGTEGCPQGFVMNAYEQCFPRDDGGYPGGYHSHEDDESGRCIPDEIPCDDGYILNPDYPECQRIEYVCDKDSTIIERITVDTNIQNATSRSRNNTSS